jgi:hypothetical protein
MGRGSAVISVRFVSGTRNNSGACGATLEMGSVKISTIVEFDSRRVKFDTKRVKFDSRRVKFDTKRVKFDSRRVKFDTKRVKFDSRRVKFDTKRVKLLCPEADLRKKTGKKTARFFRGGRASGIACSGKAGIFADTKSRVGRGVFS